MTARAGAGRRPAASMLLALLLPSLALLATPPAQAVTAPVEVVNTSPPTMHGEPAYRGEVRADPGTWQPDDVTLAYAWLLDNEPIDGATHRRYRPRLDDIGHRLRVQVTATAVDPETGEQTQRTAASEAERVVRATLTSEERPTIDGARRYDHTLAVRAGQWSHRPDSVRVRWLRDGDPIKGAHGRRLHLALADFGERIAVQLTARKDGFRKAVARSTRTARISYRVPTRRTVTYRVETRGNVVADVGEFARQAQQTYDDPRGWRNSGTAFRRVSSGGSFVLVLAEASQVPTFSSACSAEWSCRVGDYVIINQTRWLHASPMWHQQKQSLRDYRHMVVDHETGHWLGRDHATCPQAGALAPVMQQQSKGLDGCKPNPWPTPGEWRVPRFS